MYNALHLTITFQRSPSLVFLVKNIEQDFPSSYAYAQHRNSIGLQKAMKSLSAFATIQMILEGITPHGIWDKQGEYMLTLTPES